NASKTNDTTAFKTNDSNASKNHDNNAPTTNDSNASIGYVPRSSSPDLGLSFFSLFKLDDKPISYYYGYGDR
ncbi:3564_t:CDS:2, partial [Ambispora leptoticha]